MSAQKAKVLTITAEETGQDDYEFKAYELPTGECCVPYESGADCWYATRDDIEANGLASVAGIEETEETVDWTVEEIKESVSLSRREYGIDAIPESLVQYAE